LTETSSGGGGTGSNNNNKRKKKKKKKKKDSDDSDDSGGVDDDDGGGGRDGMTEEGMRALHEMLWTAYVMMLENDGKNERQLREYAHLDDWLRTFWFAEDGASFARLEIRDNSWPPYNDLADVTMWLFWFLLKPGASPFPLLSFHVLTARFHPPFPPLDFFYHICKYATQRTPRGVLCVGRGRIATRNFHIEVVGPRRT
jgi:hypothetical protein